MSTGFRFGAQRRGAVLRHYVIYQGEKAGGIRVNEDQLLAIRRIDNYSVLKIVFNFRGHKVLQILMNDMQVDDDVDFGAINGKSLDGEQIQRSQSQVMPSLETSSNRSNIYQMFGSFKHFYEQCMRLQLPSQQAMDLEEEVVHMSKDILRSYYKHQDLDLFEDLFLQPNTFQILAVQNYKHLQLLNKQINQLDSIYFNEQLYFYLLFQIHLQIIIYIGHYQQGYNVITNFLFYQYCMHIQENNQLYFTNLNNMISQPSLFITKFIYKVQPIMKLFDYADVKYLGRLTKQFYQVMKAENQEFFDIFNNFTDKKLKKTLVVYFSEWILNLFINCNVNNNINIIDYYIMLLQTKNNGEMIRCCFRVLCEILSKNKQLFDVTDEFPHTDLRLLARKLKRDSHVQLQIIQNISQLGK